MEEHLASSGFPGRETRVSAKAAQVLLAVLLVREEEVSLSQAEFAKTHSGLSRRATPQALSELELGGLFQILTQASDSLQGVQAHQGTQVSTRGLNPRADKEIIDELIRAYAKTLEPSHKAPAVPVLPDPLPSPDQGGIGAGGGGAGEETTEEGHDGEFLLRGTSQSVSLDLDRKPAGGLDGLAGVPSGGNGASVRAVSSEGPGQEGEEAAEEGEEEASDPLGLCRRSDQSSDRKGQIVALQACWDQAFPVEEYPYQRLTPAAAKAFLVNRSAEVVGRVILDAAANARTHIQWPRSYVEKALESADKKRSRGASIPQQESEITDELRNLADIVGRQIRAKHAAQDSLGSDYQ